MNTKTSDRTILEQLTIIFREVLKDSDLILSQNMVTGDHPAWDSFANVEILLAVESRWSIQFSSKEIDRIRSIGDLLAAISSKL